MLINKICETLIHQTVTHLEETLEFKLTRPKETFDFNPPITIQGSWMMGLTSLEVNNSIFNITKHINKFELYTDTFDDFSFVELKDELEEFLDISNITSEHLQDEIIGPRTISAYRKLETEKGPTDGYIIVIMGYARSLFRVFESYLRILVGLDEDDIQLILKHYTEKLITY